MVHFIKAYQADVSTDFHPRLEQPSKVKFYARVSSRVPFLYIKDKQPNLASLRGRLTPSSDLALSCSSSVQRSFFCGDVIAITSWARLIPSPRPAFRRFKSFARGERLGTRLVRPIYNSFGCQKLFQPRHVLLRCYHA